MQFTQMGEDIRCCKCTTEDWYNRAVTVLQVSIIRQYYRNEGQFSIKRVLGRC